MMNGEFFVIHSYVRIENGVSKHWEILGTGNRRYMRENAHVFYYRVGKELVSRYMHFTRSVQRMPL